MAQSGKDNDQNATDTVDKVVSDYVAGLSPEHRMLVILKAQLYGGRWDSMLDDLNNRLQAVAVNSGTDIDWKDYDLF